jgi:hypothetical protein
VLAFGADTALRRALADQSATDFELHPIDPTRLRWESGEHGLLAEAIAVALGRERPLLVRRRRRSWVLVVDPKHIEDPALAPLRASTGALMGALPSRSGHWAEAVAVRLDWRLEQLWLLVDPILWLTRRRGPRPVADVDFVRERRARRYNLQSDQLLAAWVTVLLGGASSVRVSSFGGVDGVDAMFVLESTTAYSRRGHAVVNAAIGEAA